MHFLIINRSTLTRTGDGAIKHGVPQFRPILQRPLGFVDEVFAGADEVLGDFFEEFMNLMSGAGGSLEDAGVASQSLGVVCHRVIVDLTLVSIGLYDVVFRPAQVNATVFFVFLQLVYPKPAREKEAAGDGEGELAKAAGLKR